MMDCGDVKIFAAAKRNYPSRAKSASTQREGEGAADRPTNFQQLHICLRLGTCQRKLYRQTTVFFKNSHNNHFTSHYYYNEK